MRIILNIILHLIILFIVAVFPIVVYTVMSDHDCNDFAFIGGGSYFIYAFYLVLKIKNHRAKTILLGVLYSLLSLCIGMLFTSTNEFAIIITVIMNLAFQAFLLIKNPRSTNQTVWKSYLINFIITILFSIFFTFLWFISMASAGLPSNHY
ncbi:hypothetical protein GKZ90_0023435 [Flavobacterium sp. MC2016-06]|uniref:hypothetical protein n=1 Tax=Flavobacterium sp. MC2016-06 TaxID=2676308 RepID=UPI0012BAC9B2|nr:hypothetical protein [Flavobacterium sp. MC2016-06]MBU3860749.1 hypothetical protein [Flavobacterium sp. MC2016-06]